MDNSDWTAVKRKAARSPSLSPQAEPSPLIQSVNPFASLLASTANEKDAEDRSWSKVEKRKAKKARKNDEKLNDSPPRFFYVNSELLRRKEQVGIGDIRDLVLHLLGEAGPQAWLKVENRKAVKKLAVVFLPGVLPEHLGVQSDDNTNNTNIPFSIPLPSSNPIKESALPPKTATVKTLFGGTKEISVQGHSPSTVGKTKLPFVSRTFSHACPTKAPGDATRMHSVLGAFFQGPVPPEERKRRAALNGKENEGSSYSARNPLRYVLTPAQLRDNDYPLPSYMNDLSDKSSATEDEEWYEMPKAETSDSPLAPEIFSVDCEMCLAGSSKELTRLSVVEYPSGTVLLDELVKPAAVITDYLTQWSGITAEALKDATATLQSVRKSFLDLLEQSQQKTGHIPILLGHSLENDLRALKLSYPRIIDTALLYHHPRGRPRKPGLAWLTKKYCEREIQSKPGGHDPREDAQACAELLKRKIEGGPGYGEFKNIVENESIWDRLQRSVRGSTTGVPGSGEGAQLRTAIVDRGNPSAWHGNGAKKVVACASDEEVVKGVLQCVEENDFIWARLSGLAEAQGWLQQKPHQGFTSSSPSSSVLPDDACSTLNSHLTLIHAALPPQTAFLIFTGHGDPRKMSALQSRRAAFENTVRSAGVAKEAVAVPEGVRWTSADAHELESEVERAKRGMLLLCLK